MAFKLVDPTSLDDILDTEACTVVLEVFRNHCAPCKALEALISRYQSEFPAGTQVVALNADDYPQWAEEAGIKSVPALLIAAPGTPPTWLTGDISAGGVRRFLQSGLNIMLEEPDIQAEAFMAAGDLAALEELLDKLSDEDSRTSVLQRAKSLVSMRNMQVSGLEREVHSVFFNTAAEYGWQAALDRLSDLLIKYSDDNGVRSLAIALADVVPDRNAVQRWRRAFCGC